jgi:phosphatidylserine decarboxylase
LLTRHQYIDRASGHVQNERPFGDGIVNYLYASNREDPALIYRLLGSPWVSGLLSWVNYDFPFGESISGVQRFLRDNFIDLSECVAGPQDLVSARKIFERQIRYWERRPITGQESAVVCPADARILFGSLQETSSLFLKDKFFTYEELLGDRSEWLEAFRGGDYAVCRLTPEKYHYNHTPIAGIVRDMYPCDGQFHSCNPGAVLTLATPYSKNKRVITVIDTDVTNGTGVGLVAMVEVVALMIGDIVQCYSRQRYEDPEPVSPRMFLEKGCPKSLFRPGSSTTVLLFQKNRIEFSGDLIRNLNRSDIESRYSRGLGRPLVETDVKVRSTIGHRKGGRL